MWLCRRDTRRSIGLGGFLLKYGDVAPNGSEPCGHKFEDTVALGNYPADTHPIHTCTMPSYQNVTATVPCECSCLHVRPCIILWCPRTRSCCVDSALRSPAVVLFPALTLVSCGAPLADYIPFRALTHQGCGNLLVAGKCMATTFHGNSATRVHPSEWTSGVAAGAAAVLMVVNGWNTSEVLANVKTLQSTLQSAPLKQPLEWYLPSNFN